MLGEGRFSCWRMGCTGLGCLAALAVFCRALGDAPSRGKSLVPAPGGLDGHPWFLRRGGPFVGATEALGCKWVPALLQGEGLAQARVKELGSAVTVVVAASVGHCSMLGFLLHAYLTAGRGCPVVVYGCFGEGFVSFWGCTCLYKSIYTCTFIYESMHVCGRRAIMVSPYPDKRSPRMQSRVSRWHSNSGGRVAQAISHPKMAGPFLTEGLSQKSKLIPGSWCRCS